jgi:hypothetical protein
MDKVFLEKALKWVLSIADDIEYGKIVTKAQRRAYADQIKEKIYTIAEQLNLSKEELNN